MHSIISRYFASAFPQQYYCPNFFTKFVLLFSEHYGLLHFLY